MSSERQEPVSFSLDGKVAIVTGGAGAIGPEYARALGEAGAAVVIADLNGEGAEAVAKELEREGLRAIGVEVDIASEESAAAMAGRTKEAFGGIDILVNNAALTSVEASSLFLMEIPLDLFDDVMKVNLAGQLICARACVPSMIERGGGKIINQASAAAFTYLRPYGVSKLALIGLTAGLARELGPHGINVNALAPGFLETAAAIAAVPAEGRQQILDSLALDRHGMPVDLLGALVFLASPASDWITGQCLSVDGGWVMRT
jgi:NAD(P)-dependent dehydrogenase (short-subunit alcohol dehydrogenase family)